jgi:hypothetical protein
VGWLLSCMIGDCVRLAHDQGESAGTRPERDACRGSRRPTIAPLTTHITMHLKIPVGSHSPTHAPTIAAMVSPRLVAMLLLVRILKLKDPPSPAAPSSSAAAFCSPMEAFKRARPIELGRHQEELAVQRRGTGGIESASSLASIRTGC